MTVTNVLKHKISIIDHILIHTKQFRIPHALKAEVSRQIDALLKKGIIQHSRSPYNSSLWIVPKKAETD